MKRKLRLNLSDFLLEIGQIDLKTDLFKRLKIELDNLECIDPVFHPPRLDDLEFHTIEEPLIITGNGLVDGIPLSAMALPKFSSPVVSNDLEVEVTIPKFGDTFEQDITFDDDPLKEQDLPMVNFYSIQAGIPLPLLTQIQLPEIRYALEIHLESLNTIQNDDQLFEPQLFVHTPLSLSPPLLESLLFVRKASCFKPDLELRPVDFIDIDQIFASANQLQAISRAIVALPIDEPSSKQISLASLAQPQFRRIDPELPTLKTLDLLQSTFLSNDVVGALSQLLHPVKSFEIGIDSKREYKEFDVSSLITKDSTRYWNNLWSSIASVYEFPACSHRSESDYLYLEDFGEIGEKKAMPRMDTSISEEIVESSQKDHEMYARNSEDDDFFMPNPAIRHQSELDDADDVAGIVEFSATNAVEKFLLLRGKLQPAATIESSSPTPPLSVSAPPVLEDTEDVSDVKSYWDQLQETCHDFKTKQVSNQKYLASSGIIKNKPLMLLLERDFNLELVERDLASTSIILDSKTVLFVVPFQELMSISGQEVGKTEIGDLLCRLGTHFSAIHLVFEHITSEDRIRANPFTPPTCAAIVKLQTFLKHTLCDSMGTMCKIWYSVNDLQTATIIRLCGDACYGDLALDDRSWLSDIPSKQELFLTNFPGLNHFSSQLVLLKYPLAKLAKTSKETLCREFQTFIPPPRVKLFMDYFHRPFP